MGLEVTVDDHATRQGTESAGESPSWAGDYVREAAQECLWSAHGAAGSPAVDVPALNQINVMLGNLSSHGSGYWQIRLHTDPSGAEFKIMLGKGHARSGHLPPVKTIRLGTSPGTPSEASRWLPCALTNVMTDQPTGRSAWQDKPPDPEPEPVRLRRAEDGPVALIRCHPSPGSDQVADGDVAALTALCQWLSDLHSRDLLIPSDQIPLTPNSRQAAEVRQADVVVAYDPENGQGAWSRRVRPAPVPPAHDPGSPQVRPATDLPSVSREDQPPLQRDGGRPPIPPVGQTNPGVTAGDGAGQAAAQAETPRKVIRTPSDEDTSQPSPGQQYPPRRHSRATHHAQHGQDQERTAMRAVPACQGRLVAASPWAIH